MYFFTLCFFSIGDLMIWYFCNWKQGLGIAVICLSPGDFDCCVLSAWVNEISNWVLYRNQQLYRWSHGEWQKFHSRHFKTMQEFGYHTSVFLFCNFNDFFFLSYCRSFATIRGLGNSHLILQLQIGKMVVVKYLW